MDQGCRHERALNEVGLTFDRAEISALCEAPQDATRIASINAYVQRSCHPITFGPDAERWCSGFMRPALERLLANPSALRLLRSCTTSSGPCSVKVACRDGGRSSRGFGIAQIIEEEGHSISSNQSERFEAGQKKNLSLSKRLPPLNKSERVIEQTGQRPHERKRDEIRERQVLPQRSRPRISEDKQDAANWLRILEIVRERRRHSRLHHAEMVFRKIAQCKLNMPTEGEVAMELWDHFVQILNRDSKSLVLVAEYAVRLRQRTGRARFGIYGHLMGQSHTWRSQSLTLSLHQVLKADFPPTPADYTNLLRVSLRVGRKSLVTFENIYKDHPVPFLYSAVVPKLCMQGMQKEATEWHYLLLKHNDLPKSFHDCKPLLEFHALAKDDKVVEGLVRSLAQCQVWFEKDMDHFVQNDSFISREIMNRALGEAHGIAPKTLSDGFCARLLATKFFSVDLVISGLQAIGVEALGPSSVRELVLRDDYICEDVVYHMGKLQKAGISFLASKYNTMIKKAAIHGQSELLRSIVDADLHPDTFEDINLQERLLAMYSEKGDHAQMERTFAIIESTVPERSLKMQRANLLLRCHTSLGNRAKVISLLESMKRNRYPLTPRSSRHLRRAYLTPRRTGTRPSKDGEETENLTIIINVMKMTLESGGFIPLESWREILRRLGMMGHLAQYQNLALWLVDWYTRLSGPAPPLSFDLPEAGPEGLFPSSTRLSRPPTPTAIPRYSISPPASMNNAILQHNDFQVLFNIQAQQAMIAWGFQAEVKRRPNLPHPRNIRLPNPRTHWQWGLILLKELQGRGVLINKNAIAKGCKLRLAQLFNHKVVSKKRANRRAKEVNDERSILMAKYRYSAYVKGMEEIWGRDLFHKRNQNAARGQHSYHGSMRGKWRIVQSYKRINAQKVVHSDKVP